MNEIKCPHCQTVFTIDENSYADIVSQVRNKEFAEDVHKQLEFAKKQFETEKALAKEQESVYMMRNVPTLNRRFFRLN